jgi:hypothetical protein
MISSFFFLDEKETKNQDNSPTAIFCAPACPGNGVKNSPGTCWLKTYYVLPHTELLYQPHCYQRMQWF